MIEQLGFDPNRLPSSQGHIKRGPNRGFLHSEKNGKWHAVSSCLDRKIDQIQICLEWAIALTKINARIGTTTRDGVITFWIFLPSQKHE